MESDARRTGYADIRAEVASTSLSIDATSAVGAETPEAILDAVLRIRDIAELADRWDGADAKAVSAKVVANAVALVLRVGLSGSSSIQAIPFTSAPIPDGGLQLEWQGPESRIEVLVAPDGTFGYVIVADGDLAHGDDLDLVTAASRVQGVLGPWG